MGVCMGMEANVRPMREEDAEQVGELEKRCFSEPWSNHLLLSGLASPFDKYFVYEEKGSVLGYGVIRVLAGEGEIQRIAVLPQHRRGGIGRKLMEAMLLFARKAGVCAIALEVRESNESARNLYVSYGFRPEAVRKGYYHNPAEDAVIMWNRRL